MTLKDIHTEPFLVKNVKKNLRSGFDSISLTDSSIHTKTDHSENLLVHLLSEHLL